MSPYPFDELLISISSIFLLGFGVSLVVTKKILLAFFMATSKAMIFYIYFGLQFDGSYTYLDDWGYLIGGIRLLNEYQNSFDLVLGLTILRGLAGGDHSFYYLYNMAAVYIFGSGYFSPVTLNILFTILVSYFGTQIANDGFDLKGSKKKLFYVFLYFQPDIMTWSSIVNCKDILVLLLHVFLITAILKFQQGKHKQAIAYGLPSTIILFSLRFYVPLIFLLAWYFSSFILFETRKLLFRTILFILIFAVIYLEIDNHIYESINKLVDNFVNPFYGIVRFSLTPYPFGIDKNYAFLFYSALIHWLLFPFALVGLKVIWDMKTPFTFFFSIYIATFFLLYSIFGDLQGPRHRVQMDFALSIMQFLGLSKFFTSLSGLNNRN